MKLTNEDKRKLIIPPKLESEDIFCVFCERIQPISEQGDIGGWCFLSGTMGHVACPQCAKKKFPELIK